MLAGRSSAFAFPCFPSTLMQSVLLGAYFPVQWLLLAFLNGLPTDTTLRVWDLFFVAGPRVLLAASVAAVQLLEGQLQEAAGSFEESACQPPRVMQ